MGNILDELHVCDLVEVELSECDLVEVYTAGKLEPFREDPDNAEHQEKVATLRKSREIQPSRFSGRPSTEDLPLANLFVDDLQVRDPNVGVAGEVCRAHHLADNAQAVPESQTGLGKKEVLS